MAPKFAAIEDEKLINAVSSHRAIYDSENVDYKNQHIKDNIWEVIAKETERSVDDCKKRWKCIRDSYLKIKKSQKTTTGQPAIKRPKWSLYELLSFLDSVPAERSSVNTVQPIEEESMGTDTYNLDFQEHENSANEVSSQNDEDETACTIQSTPSTQSTTNPFFKNRQKLTSDAKLLEGLKKRSAERTAAMTKVLLKDEDEDEIDIFMRSIAVQVKKLPPQLIAEAKMGILSLVNRLQFPDTLQPIPSNRHSFSSSNHTYDVPYVSPDPHTQYSFPSTSHSDSESNFSHL